MGALEHRSAVRLVMPSRIFAARSSRVVALLLLLQKSCAAGKQKEPQHVWVSEFRRGELRGRPRRRRGFGRVVDSGGVWRRTGRHSPVGPSHARASHAPGEGTSAGSEQCWRLRVNAVFAFPSGSRRTLRRRPLAAASRHTSWLSSTSRCTFFAISIVFHSAFLFAMSTVPGIELIVVLGMRYYHRKYKDHVC